MSIGEDLRTFIITNDNILDLLPDAADGGVVQQNTIDQESPDTRIWFQRADTEHELDQDGTKGLKHIIFDIEIMSLDIDVALDLTEVVKDELHGYMGTFGNSSVLGIFVESHGDEYEPKGTNEDEGLNVSALQVKIIH